MPPKNRVVLAVLLLAHGRVVSVGPARRRTGLKPALGQRFAAFRLATIGALPELAEAVPAHAATVPAALAPWSTGGQLPNFAPSIRPASSASATSCGVMSATWVCSPAPFPRACVLPVTRRR
jgi:hypothetical protein